jgi:hypothetical protein
MLVFLPPLSINDVYEAIERSNTTESRQGGVFFRTTGHAWWEDEGLDDAGYGWRIFSPWRSSLVCHDTIFGLMA